MEIKHLKGLIAAPFTPMSTTGALNLDLVADYYRMLKINGISGAFICGSTGEGPSLTLTEKKLLAAAWAEATKRDAAFKVITLVGGTCIADAIELARHAEEVGLYAVSFTAPFYFKPASADILAMACEEVAASVPAMPFYYYHIPVLTGVNIQMIDLLKAAGEKIPNFAGIKYTHEDFMDYLSCLNYKNGRYDMLWGRDENMLSALVLGAKGAVGSTYNYAAPLYQDLMTAYHLGDMHRARILQQQAIDMISLLGKYGGIATGKAYMKLIGLDCGEFRLPVKHMSEIEFSTFEKDVATLNFNQFRSRLPDGVIQNVR